MSRTHVVLTLYLRCQKVTIRVYLLNAPISSCTVSARPGMELMKRSRRQLPTSGFSISPTSHCWRSSPFVVVFPKFPFLVYSDATLRAPPFSLFPPVSLHTTGHSLQYLNYLLTVPSSLCPLIRCSNTQSLYTRLEFTLLPHLVRTLRPLRDPPPVLSSTIGAQLP